MRFILRNAIVLGGLLLLVACQHQPKMTSSSSDDLKRLANLMSGEFNSLRQSQEDENYYHISLKMLPIWIESNDGYWLYVEQAVGSMLDKPYRQRIYHLTVLDNNKFSSAVYELPDPKAVIGAYEKPDLLVGLKPEKLKLRTGCAVVLEKQDDGSYAGSTVKKECLSQLRGAVYATSRVVLGSSGITSWDQGFDADDKQVWGAVNGPYVFDRK